MLRLDSGNLPGEIQPMVTALNEMLDRLKSAFERERQFSANVAHELRTPLAGLKSTIEVKQGNTAVWDFRSVDRWCIYWVAK